MIQKATPLLFLLLLIATSSFSQDALFAKNSFGLRTKGYLATPMQVTQDVFGNTRKAAYVTEGGEVEFYYQRFIGNKISVNFGAMVGLYTFEGGVVIGQEIRDEAIDLYWGRSFDPLTYRGLSTKVNYFIPFFDNSTLSISVGLNSLHFSSASLQNNGPDFISIGDAEKADVFVEVNEDNKLTFAPEIALCYNIKVFTACVINVGFTRRSSASFPVKGNYVIYGANEEEVAGTFKKRYGFYGMELGFLYYLDSNPD